MKVLRSKHSFVNVFSALPAATTAEGIKLH